MKEALDRLARTRVLVVGDLMLDRYQWGEVSRISPEAPVPVVKVAREELRLGGAANVVHNLAALGARVLACGLVGEDDAGRIVRERLGALGADTGALIADADRPTTVKVRVMAHNQQMLRCDWEQAHPLADDLADALLDRLRERAGDYDGILVSDYAKGLLSERLTRGLIALGRETGKPVVIDPKGLDYARYHGATCLTPNRHEAAGAARVADLDGDDAVLDAGRRLMAELALPCLCITRGAQGVLALEAAGGGEPQPHFLEARAREVFDVTGAGDTFLSVVGGLLAAGEPFVEAVHLANLAAGVAVGKVGTATVTPSEILSYDEHPLHLYTEAGIRPVAEGLRAAGRRIVFTNGCFDLLHAGHIQYLRASRELGDVLVVGINSDASVRRLKGPARPVIGEDDRAHVLGALSFVDYVVVFDEDTPERLIRAVRPHVLTKGADYTEDTVVGHDLVRQWGGEVRLIPLAGNRSTSGIIDKIVAGHREG